VLSPGGSILLATRCEFECASNLEIANLPATLGAPVDLRIAKFDKFTYGDLVPRADGLYALLQDNQGCECYETAPHQEVRRYSWSDLAGDGTTLFSLPAHGSVWIEQLAPATPALYATIETTTHAELELSRLEAGHTVVLRSDASVQGMYLGTIDPFFG
jgi:hypothetical protein